MNIMSPTVKLQAVSAKKETSPSAVSKVSAVLPFPQPLMMDTFTPIATKSREGNNKDVSKAAKEAEKEAHHLAKILEENAQSLAKIIEENIPSTDKNKSGKG
ncbi:MAG: hypothetical protein H2174_02410 [Vampirovibrio sp.]|nr:hypothetical protein [Vampirovibrio sp.]